MASISQQSYIKLWAHLENKYDISKNNEIAFAQIHDDLIKEHSDDSISENTIKNAYYLYKYIKITHRTVKALCLAAQEPELVKYVLTEPAGPTAILADIDDKKSFLQALAGSIWEGYFFDEEGLKVSRLEIEGNERKIKLELPSHTDHILYEGRLEDVCLEQNFIDLRMKAVNDPYLRLLARFDRRGNLDKQNIFIGMYLNSRAKQIVAGTFIISRKTLDEKVKPRTMHWEEIFSTEKEFEIATYLFDKGLNKITAKSVIHTKGQLAQWIKDKRPKVTDTERLSNLTSSYTIIYVRRNGKISISRELVLKQITPWDFCAEMKNVKVRDVARVYRSCDLSLINYVLFITFAYENDRIQFSMSLRKNKTAVEGAGSVEYLTGVMVGAYHKEDGIGKYDVLLVDRTQNLTEEHLESLGKEIFKTFKNIC